MDDLMEILSGIRRGQIGAIGDLYQLQMDEGPPVTMRIPPRREKETWLSVAPAGMRRRGQDWGRQAVSCPTPLFLEGVEAELVEVLKRRGVTGARSALSKAGGALIPLPILRARSVSTWLRESIFKVRVGEASAPPERLLFWQGADDWIQSYLLQWISLHGREKQTPDEVAQARLRAGILALARGGASSAKGRPKAKSNQPRKSAQSSSVSSCSASSLRRDVERRIAAHAKRMQASKRLRLVGESGRETVPKKASKRGPGASKGAAGARKRTPKAPR